MVNNWLNIIQNLVLPPCCIFCDAPGMSDRDICAACQNDLPRNQHCCHRCGIALEPADGNRLPCGRCLKQPPSFDEVHAPFLYQEGLRHLLTGLKFARQYKHARLLGQLLADALQHIDRPQLLIPVPLHPNRYRQRGFNQSIEISRTLCKQLNLPMDLESCIRIRDTGHQTGLPAKKRRRNMQRAFQVIKPLSVQHVAIIDDVMTTGATVSALASALKKAGVKRVDVWVCGRA